MAFQKLLKFFNGTAISTFFVLPAAGVFPVILILDLNDYNIWIIQIVMLWFDSSL